MRSEFADMLGALIRQRGVLGSLVVGEDDGIIIDATLQVGVDGEVVAALAAALYRRARLSTRAAGLGCVSFLQLEAEHGYLCATGRDGLVLVALAEPRAHIGLIRSAMLQSVEALT